MGLVLVEVDPGEADQAGVERVLERIGQAVAGISGQLVEAQVTVDGGRAFVVVEHDDVHQVRAALEAAGIAAASVDQVRLVGADLGQLKAARPAGRYLVEWDLPEGLTMDAYLARKREKAPRYADVPEATFLRTYVREDMAKCLCFYDADDEGAVLKARAAVEAPVDRLHHLGRR